MYKINAIDSLIRYDSRHDGLQNGTFLIPHAAYHMLLGVQYHTVTICKYKLITLIHILIYEHMRSS